MTLRRPVLNLIALFATCFSAASQAATQQEIVQEQMRKQLDPEQIVVTLERTRCLGSCPAYRVTLTASGKLTLSQAIVTDGPSTYLELRIANHAKRVRLYSHFPSELGAIPKLIDDTVAIEQWIGTPCERPRSSLRPMAPGECDR